MWVPKRPIVELPRRVRKEFQDHADYLHFDLLENRLQVSLAEAPQKNFSSHKIRVVENCNPLWYRDLYERYDHFRRDRSLKALLKIKDAKDRAYTGERRGACSHPHAFEFVYRELILEHLLSGLETKYEPIPPNDIVCAYFGKVEGVPF